MKRRVSKKLLKQALAKREVLHKNSKPNIFIYKRYYRKNDNPVLTSKEKELLAKWDDNTIRMTEKIWSELQTK